MIAIIAAVSINGVYGTKGALPWSFKTDMDYFKQMTAGASLVMGRATWQSLQRDKPLAGRQNIVVTSNPELLLPEGVIKVSSVNEAIGRSDRSQTFLIGGKNIWLEGIRTLAQTLYITEVLTSFPEKGSEHLKALTHPGHFTNRTFSKHTVGESEIVEDVDRLTGKKHRLHFARYDLFSM